MPPYDTRDATKDEIPPTLRIFRIFSFGVRKSSRELPHVRIKTARIRRISLKMRLYFLNEASRTLIFGWRETSFLEQDVEKMQY